MKPLPVFVDVQEIRGNNRCLPRSYYNKFQLQYVGTFKQVYYRLFVVEEALNGVDVRVKLCNFGSKEEEDFIRAVQEELRKELGNVFLNKRLPVLMPSSFSPVPTSGSQN